MDRPDDHSIFVQVPRERLDEVLDLLESAPQTGRVSGLATSSQAEDNDALEWDGAALRRLIKDAPGKQVRILKLLAERAGQDVTADEVREDLLRHTDLKTTYPGRAMGAVLRALGKRSAYYDGRTPPFKADWDPGLGNHYRMPLAYKAPVLNAIREFWGDTTIS